jgi:hypothetical protein
VSDAALAVLENMAALRTGEYVFPGQRAHQPLSNMAMLMVLRRMGRGDLTAHGFRSTFSDWVAERTAFPAEVREMALAHTVGDKVEAAYRRGDLFAKRRQLADAWARYCTTPACDETRIVAIGRARLEATGSPSPAAAGSRKGTFAAVGERSSAAPDRGPGWVWPILPYRGPYPWP